MRKFPVVASVRKSSNLFISTPHPYLLAGAITHLLRQPKLPTVIATMKR
jgi:hypothetical protein